jgi:hypothetical protein
MAVEALAFFPGGCNRLPVGDRILGREDDPRSRWLDPPACGQPRRFHIASGSTLGQPGSGWPPILSGRIAPVFFDGVPELPEAFVVGVAILHD